MTRRIYTYQPDMGWAGMNLFVSLSALILAAGFALFFFDAVRSASRGAPAGDNPWHAATLEWATASPPPSYNFDRMPVVLSADPLWHDRDTLSVATGLRVDRRELIVSSLVEARPEAREASPRPSIWPLLTASATSVMLVWSIFTPWQSFGERYRWQWRWSVGSGRRTRRTTREAACRRRPQRSAAACHGRGQPDLVGYADIHAAGGHRVCSRHRHLPLSGEPGRHVADRRSTARSAAWHAGNSGPADQRNTQPAHLPLGGAAADDEGSARTHRDDNLWSVAAGPAHLRVPRVALSWDSNAYGSIVWTMLGLHTTHVLTDLADTGVLLALMFSRHG